MEDEQPTMEASADHVGNDANDEPSQQDLDGQLPDEAQNADEMEAQPEAPAANEEVAANEPDGGAGD